jgi:hypothetical protein
MEMAVILTIAIRGLGVVLLALGGIQAIRYGFRIYSKPPRANNDTLTANVAGMQLAAKGVGAVLMLTAFGWAYFSVLIAPHLDTTQNRTVVYTLQTDRGSVQVPLVSATGGLTVNVRNAAALNQEFLRAFESRSSEGNYAAAFSVDGRPAKLDVSALRVDNAGLGEIVLKAPLRSNSGNYWVEYAPILVNGTVQFQPQKATAIEKTGNQPEQ